MSDETTFEDGKDAGALRTIGEVATALDIKTHVLRYWEQQFPQLQPLKRSGGRRYYRPEDVRLVREIDRLVNREGYTLKGAQKALKEGIGGTGARPAVREAPMVADEPAPVERSSAAAPTEAAQTREAVPSDLLPRLKAIRADLAAALERA